MTQESTFFLIGYLGQALGTALFAGIFLWLNRVYRRNYLVLWAGGWAALSAYHVMACVATLRFIGFAIPTPVQVGSSMVSQAMGYGSALLLVLGALEVRRGTPLPRWTCTRLLPAVMLLATAATLLTLSAHVETRLFVRVGLRALFAGFAFLYVAYLVARSSSPRGAGRSVIVVAASLYALELFHYFGINLLMLFGEGSYGHSLYLSFVDFLLQTTMSFGMALWLVEEERIKGLTQSQELERSREQLRQAQKMEAVGQLAGGIAHDFNNMLMGILGYADLIESSPGVDAATRRHAREIRHAGERAAGMTRQLLAFSRRQVVAPRKLDLDRVVLEMRDMLRRLIETKISLVTHPAGEPAFVMADRSQVEQVLLNLVVNARDAMPAGGTIEIRVAVRPAASPPGTRGSDGTLPAAVATAGREVVLTVRDDGAGMDESTLEHAFEPFFTTKGRERGTGLGLSTVYGIVRQSDGAIEISSAPGRGTEIRVALPWVAGGADHDPPSEQGTRSIPRAKVLVVEDEEQVRQLVVLALERAGHEVYSAADGDELDRLTPDLPAIDLLVTDLVMPGRDGVQVATALRAEHPELRVLVMSGYAEPPTLKRVQRQLGAEFMPKPFAPSTLLRRVETMLASSRAILVDTEAEAEEGDPEPASA